MMGSADGRFWVVGGIGVLGGCDLSVWVHVVGFWDVGGRLCCNMV